MPDVELIHSYLKERSPGAARSVKAAIEQSILRLAEFPLLAPMTEVADVRELTLVRYPYKVYYEVVGEEVRILHVRDARRRPWVDERK